MKEDILKLKHLECYVIPESDHGKAEVYRVNDMFILFEIPLFGGDAIFDGTYFVSRIDEMIKKIESCP